VAIGERRPSETSGLESGAMTDANWQPSHLARGKPNHFACLGVGNS